MRRTNNTKAAFSLVELMFVLAIMAILAGVVAFNLKAQAENVRVDRTKIDMGTIAKALDMYELRHNMYPPSSLGLEALVHDGQFKSIPQDAWKQDFSYISPTAAFPDGYEVRSAGKDGQWETIDDIVFDPSTEQ